jgi:flagellar motility protein MotE (MotC chaperone)
MRDMLTDERLKRTEKLIGYFLDGSTEELKKEINVVFESYRTLQQQNKQLREALVIVRDTLACKKHDDRTSHGLWQVADKAIQGGTPDGTSNNNA